MRRYEHWETWAGLLLCGLCAGLGSYLGGQYLDRPAVFAGIGGGIGGWVFRSITRHVDRRYHAGAT